MLIYQHSNPELWGLKTWSKWQVGTIHPLPPSCPSNRYLFSSNYSPLPTLLLTVCDLSQRLFSLNHFSAIVWLLFFCVHVFSFSLRPPLRSVSVSWFSQLVFHNLWQQLLSYLLAKYIPCTLPLFTCLFMRWQARTDNRISDRSYWGGWTWRGIPGKVWQWVNNY